MGPEQNRSPCWDSLSHKVRVIFSNSHTPKKGEEKKKRLIKFSVLRQQLEFFDSFYHVPLSFYLFYKKYHTWYVLVGGWRESIGLRLKRLTSWPFSRKQTFPEGRPCTVVCPTWHWNVGGAGVFAGGLGQWLACAPGGCFSASYAWWVFLSVLSLYSLDARSSLPCPPCRW